MLQSLTGVRLISSQAVHEPTVERSMGAQDSRSDPPKFDGNQPIYLVSEHGDMLHLKPYARARTHKTGRTDLREVKYINDNTDAKTLLKQLNANQSAHFLFNPDRAHYLNSRTIYLALKKLLEKRYYGQLDKK